MKGVYAHSTIAVQAPPEIRCFALPVVHARKPQFIGSLWQNSLTLDRLNVDLISIVTCKPLLFLWKNKYVPIYF